MSLVTRGIDGVNEWAGSFGEFDQHMSLAVAPPVAVAVLNDLVTRLHDNYPFGHPRYAGQMLKPPHPIAVAAYAAAMQINPNAHALDGGPATSVLEKAVVADLASMIGFESHLGHLTSSGTIANLEALFIARESHPGRGVAYSTEAHYTHSRMCGVLGMPGYPVAVDERGRMDLTALADLLAAGGVGTVVATLGTTGLGAVDQVQDILNLARQHGARVHVDSAYGGFFALLGRAPLGHDPSSEQLIDPAPWHALNQVDSFVVDPHKHGLQPYGCGAVLFRDPSIGRFYQHDSPYTYFTSDELHLGEISLECSRAGAAAAALWATLQALPLTAQGGLGDVLSACRRAALTFRELVATSTVLRTYQPPELDIVTYFDARCATLSQVDESSARILAAGMVGPEHERIYVSTLKVTAADFHRRHPDLVVDVAEVRVLRSVLMKPEHEEWVEWLVARLAALAG